MPYAWGVVGPSNVVVQPIRPYTSPLHASCLGGCGPTKLRSFDSLKIFRDTYDQRNPFQTHI